MPGWSWYLWIDLSFGSKISSEIWFTIYGFSAMSKLYFMYFFSFISIYFWDIIINCVKRFPLILFFVYSVYYFSNHPLICLIFFAFFSLKLCLFPEHVSVSIIALQCKPFLTVLKYNPGIYHRFGSWLISSISIDSN